MKTPSIVIKNGHPFCLCVCLFVFFLTKLCPDFVTVVTAVVLVMMMIMNLYSANSM